MNQQHSRFSPSQAFRLIECPGSLKLEEQFADSTNIYAEEGSLAHSIAEKLLNKLPLDIEVSNEMLSYCQEYVNYINSHNPQNNPLEIERRVFFNELTPNGEEGFGTLDCGFIDNDSLHIIDFKYGRTPVSSEGNYQLALYAIGFLFDLKLNNELEYKKISKVVMHIYQPRINNISVHSMELCELYIMAGFYKAKAAEAISSKPKLNPTKDGCKYCKAKSICPALNNIYKKIVEASNGEVMSISEVLDNRTLVRDYLSSIEQQALSMITNGEELPGYTIKPGRRLKKYSDNSESQLYELFGEDIYEKRILSPSKLKEFFKDTRIDQYINEFMTSPVLQKIND